jgi:type II secretory pathway pseudopilin PulG
MIELIVVVAATVLLAAAVAPRLFSWIEEGRAARAQNDAAAVAAAMNRFFVDTTKWPGQVEILEENSAIRFLTIGDPDATAFPEFVGSIGIEDATCAEGLSGVTSTTSFASATPSSSNSLDVMNFLARPPAAADYPNWKGPYLSVELTSDPWEKVFVINIIPLFCGETVSASAPGGALGFGWILSGGPNRTLQTLFTASRVGAGTDDVGVTLSKRAVQAP